MKALLEKMEAKGESPAFKERELVVCEDLDHIFGEHKLDKNSQRQLYDDLMAWKKHDH